MRLFSRYLIVVPVILLLAAGLFWVMSRPAASPQPAQPAVQAQPLDSTATPSPQPTATPQAPEARPTATVALVQTATPTPAPTVLLFPTPGPTVASDLAQEYIMVRPNQVLGSIASRYGVSVEEIARASGIENPDLLSIGQGLIIPHRTQRYTPAERLLPDSELVYGLAYVDFDLASFIAEQGGYLAQFSMTGNDGETWSAADVIERVALRYSVGPRALLALIEARSGLVTNPNPLTMDKDYPVGHLSGGPGLLSQLEWAADELNRGFYGWLDRGETAIRFQDGVVARGEPGLNPGTVAVQRALARDSSWADIGEEATAFAAAYQRLFGSPLDQESWSVLPAGLQQPPLVLPWAQGEWWYLTGGPHGGWVSGSGWAALDFVSEEAGIGSCIPDPSWARAVADGVVARNSTGEILLDLDGDGDVRTGWVVQYLHISDRPEEGQFLKVGDPVGHPSCEGGAADSTHLHIARRYNGLWVAAEGPASFVMDGWTPWGDFEYSGGLTKPGAAPREACDCREKERNGLTW